MCSIPFHVKTYKNKNNFFINYKSGQGMGFYTSWAFLAFTHHVIVKLSSLRCGIKDFNDYLILGDDIVIAKEKVAIEYQKIMENLGVSISQSKSVVSNDNFIRCEFASRQFSNGEEISHLPLGLILDTRHVMSLYHL